LTNDPKNEDPPGGKDSNAEIQKILAEYGRAQEVGQHSDTVTLEVAAIVWGSNTLLLGFILEVDCNKSNNQKLVVVAACLGILMSLFVPLIQFLTKIGQHIAFEVCRKIEDELSLPHRLNNRINEHYPKGAGQWAIWILTMFFVAAWCIVIFNACSCILKTPCG